MTNAQSGMSIGSEMADTKMDIIKSDPIETLNKASNVSLQGGGVLIVLAAWLLYQNNKVGWNVGNGILYMLVGGSVLLGAAAAGLRVFDAYLRYKLADRLITIKGTSDPEKAAELAPIGPISWEIQTLDRVLGNTILLLQPQEQVTVQASQKDNPPI